MPVTKTALRLDTRLADEAARVLGLKTRNEGRGLRAGTENL